MRKEALSVRRQSTPQKLRCPNDGSNVEIHRSTQHGWMDRAGGCFFGRGNFRTELGGYPLGCVASPSALPRECFRSLGDKRTSILTASVSSALPFTPRA